MMSDISNPIKTTPLESSMKDDKKPEEAQNSDATNAKEVKLLNNNEEPQMVTVKEVTVQNLTREQTEMVKSEIQRKSNPSSLKSTPRQSNLNLN